MRAFFLLLVARTREERPVRAGAAPFARAGAAVVLTAVAALVVLFAVLIAAMSGRVLIDGVDVRELDLETRRAVKLAICGDSRATPVVNAGTLYS